MNEAESHAGKCAEFGQVRRASKCHGFATGAPSISSLKFARVNDPPRLPLAPVRPSPNPVAGKVLLVPGGSRGVGMATVLSARGRVGEGGNCSGRGGDFYCVDMF